MLYLVTEYASGGEIFGKCCLNDIKKYQRLNDCTETVKSFF